LRKSLSLFAILFVALIMLGASSSVPKRAAAFPGSDNLRLVEQTCDGFGNVTLRVTWQSYNTGDQWFDVSTVNGEFVWGQFFGHGPFTLGQNITDRGGLLPNTVYYTRVNTAVFPFWIPSNTLVLTTRTCTPTGGATGSPLQTCDGFGGVTARFSWQSYGEGDYWLDVSYQNGSFEWGTFFGQGPFTSRQTSLDRGGLFANTTYYVRVNAAIFPNWVPTPTFVFRTIDCSQLSPTPTTVPATATTVPATATTVPATATTVPATATTTP